MDLSKIRLEVFRETGLNIDVGDPFYAALAMIAALAEEMARTDQEASKRLDNIVIQLAKANEEHHKKSIGVLNDVVGRLNDAVDRVTGMQDGIAKAAAEQAQELLGPVVSSTASVLEKLEQKDRLALQHLQRTGETQRRWATNAMAASASILLSLAIVAGCSYFAGRVSAQKEIQANAEWLSTAEGKYALQLRDAGSLVALATCNAGPFPNNWTKSKDGRVCHPNETNGITHGWYINP